MTADLALWELVVFFAAMGLALMGVVRHLPRWAAYVLVVSIGLYNLFRLLEDDLDLERAVFTTALAMGAFYIWWRDLRG